MYTKGQTLGGMKTLSKPVNFHSFTSALAYGTTSWDELETTGKATGCPCWQKRQGGGGTASWETNSKPKALAHREQTGLVCLYPPEMFKRLQPCHTSCAAAAGLADEDVDPHHAVASPEMQTACRIPPTQLGNRGARSKRHKVKPDAGPAPGWLWSEDAPRRLQALPTPLCTMRVHCMILSSAVPREEGCTASPSPKGEANPTTTG